MDRSTIAAIATPEGFGGIGIIKISGPAALTVIQSIFIHAAHKGDHLPTGSGEPAAFQSWRIYYGAICDPDHGRRIDEVVIAVMKAPYSYTREDVVEIQAHAGPKVLRAILELLLARGVRLAEPGEFTRRAYMNGRIDLSQAEAVIDLINAKSDAAIDMVMSQMSGDFGSMIEKIREAIVSALAQIEVGIDFPEAVEEDLDFAGLQKHLSERVAKPVSELIDAYDQNHILRDGLRVVIVGGPNVGKSSLLNSLTRQKRAIVTDIPGTTRDFIESSMIARGIPIILADTAGLRSNPDPVERLGIEKTREYIETADIILFTVDVSEPIRPDHLSLFDELSNKQLLLVINKTDLPEAQKAFQLPTQWRSVSRVEISALYGIGIPELKELIADKALHPGSDQRHAFVPNARQKDALTRALNAITDAMRGIREHSTPELLAVDLRDGLTALGEITGEHVRDDVLDEIFGQYCIGK